MCVLGGVKGWRKQLRVFFFAEIKKKIECCIIQCHRCRLHAHTHQRTHTLYVVNIFTGRIKLHSRDDRLVSHLSRGNGVSTCLDHPALPVAGLDQLPLFGAVSPLLKTQIRFLKSGRSGPNRVMMQTLKAFQKHRCAPLGTPARF